MNVFQVKGDAHIFYSMDISCINTRTQGHISVYIKWKYAYGGGEGLGTQPAGPNTTDHRAVS